MIDKIELSGKASQIRKKLGEAKSSYMKVNKKSGEELQQYLMWRRRGSVVLAKKGKGAKYNRQKMKVKNYTEE